MTRTDLILTLHALSRDYSFDAEDSNLALIRGDILCALPSLLSMSKGEECCIAFRPFGFECEPSIQRMQDNPLYQHAKFRQSWRVFVDEYGFWQMYRLVD